MARPSQSPTSDVSNADGSVDFSGGVDSLKVTTVQSEQNPNGLARNELSWLINGTVRDGGITPRAGWKALKQVGTGSFAYQGGYMYQPIDGSDPYLILLIGGRPIQVRPDDAGITDLFSTAYQFGINDRPSITLKNLGLVPGSNVTVAPDIQSLFGLPSSFIAPATGANISFFTNGDVPGNVGDNIIFYGSFSVQATTATFDGAALAWKFTVTLKNESYPAGRNISFNWFGNPHGNPVSGQITNWSSTIFAPFVSPAIGATVDVVFTQPADVRIGKAALILFQTATQVMGYSIGASPNDPGETITYDSGTNTLVDTMIGLAQIGGISVGGTLVNNICGKTFGMSTGTPIPQGPAYHVDCTQVANWVFDAFNSPSGGVLHLVARQPAVVPNLGLNIGDILNFPMGVAVVTNINRTTTYSFGSALTKPYFCQGNEFLVIQAGDNASLPLFWDGTTLRKSIGITNSEVAPGTPGVNELPPGTAMDFYMGRFWYAQGISFSAGDITGGTSGTAQYNFRDSILNVTENPLVLGGDGFATPANEGSITALSHNANQDAALGQGTLFAFTMKGVHALTVPVTRSDWINANSQNQPRIVPIQLANGTASDRSVVTVNGDLFYQDPQGNIRTLLTAVRYFGQWGNLPVSANIQRLTKFTDASLLTYGTGIYFDNRMIQSALPILSAQGCVHQALSVLDFESISSFGNDLKPIWEGMYEGLDILQLFTGVFSGKERAFAIVISRRDLTIQLWELTKDSRFDNTDRRIQMIAEMPAFTFGNEFSLKKQIAAELWVDRLYGEVVFTLEYRPDGESCWYKWHEWKVCSPRNSCEATAPNPCTGLVAVQCYPMTQYGESYRQTMTLPTPPQACSQGSGRPANINYQCQPRLTVQGFCRVRGFLLHAEPVEKKLWEGKVC